MRVSSAGPVEAAPASDHAAAPSSSTAPSSRWGPATVERAISWLAEAADRADDRRLARLDPAVAPHEAPGPTAVGWATVKLAALVAVSPVAVAVLGARAAVKTARVKTMIGQYPAEVARVAAGQPTSVPAGRVGRIDAAGRYFVSSDLHRCIRGAADWPAAQNTKALYEAVLDHYGAQQWSLIENGDVEDFWLVGGSTYGVAYDVLRMACGVVPGRTGRRWRAHLAGEHLRRIVANNSGIYARIEALFHRHGRYHRLVGNHDDWFLDEQIVDQLRRRHEGLAVHDFLVLEHDGRAVAVVAHGHHTDSWNAPRWAGIGKLVTWMGSAVIDAPYISSNPGAPGPAATEALLDGLGLDELTVVSPTLGLNRELYTVDEVLLFEAFERSGAGRSAPGRADAAPADVAPADAARDVAAGADGQRDEFPPPLLLLGHTHLPVAQPLTPGDKARRWSTYYNSGSGVHHELVTGLEWVGGDGPANPTIRLVGWHYADERTPAGAVVAEAGGRPVARREFVPRADGRTLDVLPAPS